MLHLPINESTASESLLHQSVIKTVKDHIFFVPLSSHLTVHSFAKQKMVLQMQKLSSIQPHKSFPHQTIKKAAISLKNLQWHVFTEKKIDTYLLIIF